MAGGAGLVWRDRTDRCGGSGGVTTGGGLSLARFTNSASWVLFIGIGASPWHVSASPVPPLAVICPSCPLLRWVLRLRPSQPAPCSMPSLLRRLRRIGQGPARAGCLGQPLVPVEA